MEMTLSMIIAQAPQPSEIVIIALMVLVGALTIPSLIVKGILDEKIRLLIVKIDEQKKNRRKAKASQCENETTHRYVGESAGRISHLDGWESSVH